MVGRASLAATEQIRQASDIVGVVASYITLKRSGRHFKALCPFHREKTPSFQVNPDMQIFKCFGCGVGGDVFKFVQLRENVGFLEARTILAAKAGISIEEDRGQDQRADGLSTTDLERVNRWARGWFQQQLRQPAGKHALAYLQSRGISEESIERFALGYAPDSWDSLRQAASGRGIKTQHLVAAGLMRERPDGSGVYDGFRHRIMFPIRDVMDRTVGFGGRTLGDDKAKYVNSPQSILFDKRRCLYGLDLARQAFRGDDRTAIVVEGYTDCIMAQQHGFGHTVATLGTSLTPEHVGLLKRYVDSVILVFDSDAAGQRAADQSLKLFLSEQLDVRLAHVPEAKDPADLLQKAGSAAFNDVLTSASEALVFKWKQVLRQYEDAATGPGRRRAIEEFLGLVDCSADLGACDPIQRGLILNQVGKLLGLPSEEVHRQLRIIGRRSARTPAERTGPVPWDACSKSPDAGSMAMRALLGVLLNEPSYYASIASVFEPDLLSDDTTREIAVAVTEMAREEPEFTLSQLLGRFESIEAGQRIVALQTSGEFCGNFAATVEGAVKRLQDLREHRRIDRLEAGSRSGRGLSESEAVQPITAEVPQAEELDEQTAVRALGQSARNMRYFAARRHSRAPMSPTGQPEGPSGRE